MPLSSDPSATAPYVLPSDRDKPEPRPVFHCRFITKRESDQHGRLIEESGACKGVGIFDVLWKAIAIGVVGWENMPLAAKGLPADQPFTREAMEAVLTEGEIMKLAAGYVNAVRLAEDDRKNSSSPPLSNPEGAATATANGMPTATGPVATAQP